MDNTINAEEIKQFLGKQNDISIHFMENVISFRNAIKKLITENNLDDVFILDKFEIKEEELNDFKLGNFDYTLNHMSTMQFLFAQFEADKNATKIFSK